MGAPVHRLAPLLQARSVAVVGASADPSKVGGRPLEYLRRFGFEGRIVAVNPQRSEVQGLRCVRSIEDAEPVDLAILAAPAATARESVEQCLRAGTKAIVLFTAGFAELDASGRAAQEALANAATDRGAILLGPNCLGAINAHSRLVATFTTALDGGELRAGGFSYFGQSGALGAYWIEKALAAGLGISKWITTGNEAQITLAEALDYLAHEQQTRLIGAYVEDIKRPEAFARAARAAQAAGKTVMVLKSGGSLAGRSAIRAHTGADPADDGDEDAFLEDCGVVRVDSLTQMVDAARLLSSRHPPSRARRVGIVTVSGGAGALLCDALDRAGLEILDLPASTVKELDGVLPAFVRRQNPIDVTGAVLSDETLLAGALAALTHCADCDAIVLFLGAMRSIRTQLVDAIARAEPSGKPLVVIWMGVQADARARIEELGIPVFEEIPVAARALGAASWSPTET